MGSDTKRLIIGMVLALGVLFGWNKFMAWKWPEWYAKENQPAVQPAPAPVTPAPSTVTTAAATTQATPGAATPAVAAPTAPAPSGVWRARGVDAAQSGAVTLGSPAADDNGYVMAVALVGRGAAIDSVTLNQFRKVAQDKVTRYSFQQPYDVDGTRREDTHSFMTRSVTLTADGASHEVDLSNATWKLLDGATDSSASFSVDVVDGEAVKAKVVKTFTLSKRSDDPKAPQGYEVNVAQRVENLTGKDLGVRVSMNGPTAPPPELENQPDQNFIFGYGHDGNFKVMSHPLASDFTKDHAWKEFPKVEKERGMLWLGTQSAYFNAIARPVVAAPDQPAPWLAKVYGELLNPANEHVDQHRVVLRYEADAGVIAAKGFADVGVDAYFGPKGRKVLKTDYYAGAPRHYDETLVITADSGFAWLCSWCTWQWLINVLVVMLTAFHYVTRDWGLAIIGLVLVVRALLHPITKKSQVHMVKMQKMGPEMEKLKKKYADDKEALQKAQVQFYKEQGFTPIFGCLPMFLQMPIWIALWNSLQSTFELRHSPFLYGFTWIQDLSKPDYLIRFEHPFTMWFITMRGINLLPLLMAVVMYFQAKTQPKPATMTPEQEQQQKMMKWMSTLLFPFMLYSGPAGLNLYIMTSTLFGIIESKVIRKHIKEREALLAAAGPTIVDEEPPQRGGGGGGSKKKPDPKPPKPMGWLARLQERAEQIRAEAQKPKPKR